MNTIQNQLLKELQNNLKRYQAILNSYFGMLKHVKGYNLRKVIGKKVRSEIIFPVKDYKKFEIQNNPKNL